MTFCSDDEAYFSRAIARQDLIPYLRNVLQHEYDQGYNATCDAIEDAITEIERLSDIAKAQHIENRHLRDINQRMVETLVEIAPLKQFVWTLDIDKQNSSRQSAIIGNGGDSGSDTKPPAGGSRQDDGPATAA